MNRLTILLLAAALGLAEAGSAPAQSPGQKPPVAPTQAKPAPARPHGGPSDQPPLTLRGVVSVGMTSLTSAQSFDAVAGTHSAMTFGFGGEVQNIWRNVFAGVAFSPMGLDGERVFVDNGVVYPLGIPVDISVNSLDIVGGWRFALKSKGAKPAPPRPGQKPAKEPLAQVKGQAPPQKPQQAAAKPATAPGRPSKLVPFVGGGLSMVMYKESSANSNGEDVSESAKGLVVLGGVDYALTKWIQLGGEFRYRAVKGVLGSDGVSKLYGEDSVGGWSVGVRVSIGKAFEKKPAKPPVKAPAKTP